MSACEMSSVSPSFASRMPPAGRRTRRVGTISKGSSGKIRADRAAVFGYPNGLDWLLFGPTAKLSTPGSASAPRQLF